MVIDAPDELSPRPLDAALRRDETVFQITSKTIGGIVYPALQPRDLAGAARGEALLAADADGDGIADAVYFLLPVRDIDGLSWYAAVRIVDNSAVVNVSTAWTWNPDRDSGGASLPTAGLFSGDVGLL